MITNWKQNNELQQLQHYETNCWVSVVSPTQEEIKQLVSDFKIPQSFITDILDVDERSRMEIDEQMMLIIIRIPVAKPDHHIPYVTYPLGIIVNPDNIITISHFENDIINDLIHPLRLRTCNLQQKINFVLNIILRSSIVFLKYLKEINAQTIEIDRDLKKSTHNRELYKLLRIEKCMVYFITSLKSNELLLEKIEHSKKFSQNEMDEDLLEDAIIETRQASEMATIYNKILNGMMETFGSIINNNLNIVMKTLTSVTILLMLPTLISSFYGMNIKLPYANHEQAFFIVLGLSLILSIAGWFFLFFAEKLRFFKFRRSARKPFTLKEE
jgi:magnesium transporter